MARRKRGSVKDTDTLLITSVDLASADVTGILAVANGGTGTGSYTDGQILVGQTSGNTLTKRLMSGVITMSALGVTEMISGLIVLRDEKTSGTNGGTFTTGAWRTRDLNTETIDDALVCSLAGNQFTLAAGTYEIIATCPAYFCDHHQARLRDITNGTTVIQGTTERAHNTTVGIITRSVIRGRFTCGASTVFEIQHACTVTRLTDGFGQAVGLGTEVYTEVLMRKVA